MNNDLYNGLKYHSIPEEGAKNFSKLLTEFPIGYNDLRVYKPEDKDRIESLKYVKYDPRVAQNDMYSTWVEMRLKDDGKSSFWGYQMGVFFSSFEFFIDENGKMEVCEHDTSEKTLFDKYDPMYIITNKSNPYDKEESENLHWYYFDLDSVNRVIEYQKKNRDYESTPFDAIPLDDFFEAGVTPIKKGEVKTESRFDPYEYVGLLIAKSNRRIDEEEKKFVEKEMNAQGKII